MPNTDNNPQGGVGGSSYIYEYGTSPNTRIAVSQKSRVMTPHYGSSEKALHQMGVLGSFTVQQAKNAEHYRGIGFGDVIAELVPNVTDPATLDFSRALMYLSTLWQSLGYAAGVDGPVRSLSHHRWPFDVEHQMVFSSLADADLVNQGTAGGQAYTGQGFNAGVAAVSYPQVTNEQTAAGGHPGANTGHTALITVYEACWLTSYGVTYDKDTAIVLETGNATVTSIHDFSSVYGEFLATGNDPTIGQLGSIRFSQNNPNLPNQPGISAGFVASV